MDPKPPPPSRHPPAPPSAASLRNNMPRANRPASDRKIASLWYFVLASEHCVHLPLYWYLTTTTIFPTDNITISLFFITKVFLICGYSALAASCLLERRSRSARDYRVNAEFGVLRAVSYMWWFLKWSWYWVAYGWWTYCWWAVRYMVWYTRAAPTASGIRVLDAKGVST